MDAGNNFIHAQYSAASFIETINSNSLSMDSDEFVARMVAAGIPDLQMLPEPEAPLPNISPVIIPAGTKQLAQPTGFHFPWAYRDWAYTSTIGSLDLNQKWPGFPSKHEPCMVKLVNMSFQAEY